MEGINRIRQGVWNKQAKGFMEEAFIDVDGTIAQTRGKCKGGMGISYKGIWGYAPLIVTLANTREVLYMVNRPGNETSHEGCVKWIDRAVELVRAHAGKICLRGDTDFSLTENFDRWDEEGTGFIYREWMRIPKWWDWPRSSERRPGANCERLPKHEIATESRAKAPRVKEGIVHQKDFENKVLEAESVAELDYRPNKCKKTYRMVVVRKNISVQKGEVVLFDEIRYFFYITNRRDLTKEQVVAFCESTLRSGERY